VPLKEEHAWLLHATSDGLPDSASLSPPWPGRVWDSAACPVAVDGDVHPYLWLGMTAGCVGGGLGESWVGPRTRRTTRRSSTRQRGEVQMVFHLGRRFRLTEPRRWCSRSMRARSGPAVVGRALDDAKRESDGTAKGRHLHTARLVGILGPGPVAGRGLCVWQFAAGQRRGRECSRTTPRRSTPRAPRYRAPTSDAPSTAATR